MAVLHRRHLPRSHGRRYVSLVTTFTLLLFLSVSTATLTQAGNYGTLKEREEEGRSGLGALITRFLAQKRLAGPGSSPPTCRSKCGRCSPCKPVHVPIHPGIGMPLEYYPEAWRCKCGNKLFMP